MYFKVAFKNKSYQSSRSTKTSSIHGEMVFKYNIIDNVPEIVSGMLILFDGTEFNTHQQSTWPTTQGERWLFSHEYGVSINSDEKSLLLLSTSQLNWWNNHFENNRISLLNISKFLTGNNPTGAQQNKASSEFILKDGTFEGKPFVNLLKVFSPNRHIKSDRYSAQNIEGAISFEEFLSEITSMNTNIQSLVDIFYSSQNYFYIDEAKELLGIDTGDTISSLRQVFRNRLISTYQRKDQLYKVFTARKMVEAAHIKPVSHDASNDEITDINNGILLSPDIHKLFDSGAVTFSNEGDVIYTTSNVNEPFNISRAEVERLQLNAFSLSSELLTPERLVYLEYHRENIYLHGV